MTVSTSSVLSGRVGGLGGEDPPIDEEGRVVFVVDSGADMMIGGSFLYAVSDVIARSPDIWVRGVDGGRTAVDTVMRTAVVMGDGMHVVSEVLVCNSFRVALWSVPYATHFGFAALFEQAGRTSSVRTPTGYEQPILLGPYRMPLWCALVWRGQYGPGFHGRCRRRRSLGTSGGLKTMSPSSWTTRSVMPRGFPPQRPRW